MALATVATLVAGEADDTQAGQIVVEQAAQVLGARDVRLALLDSDPEWLVLHHAAGRAAPSVGARQPSGEGALGHVTQSGEAFIAADFAAHALAAADPDAPVLGSVMAVPLRFKGEVLGAVQAARAPDQLPFAASDQVNLQLLADLAAVRLGASQQAAALRARAQELATLDPAWRPPPDQAGDFVMVVNTRGQLVDVDEAACRVLDYPREVLLQRTMAELVPLPPGVEWVEGLRPAMEQLLSGKAVTFDSTMRRRDGSLVPHRVQLQAFSSPEGPVVRGVCRDISAEKRAQVRASEAEKMRLLREIGSGLAHEINSPLAVVLGNTEMLLDETMDPEQRALLAPAREAALRIAAAVQDIQQFARPVALGAWTPVDLSLLAWETVELARPMW